ncbi:MAG TPA: diguanylate cyclase [Candidatus Nanopelagicales bacterium]
MVTTPEEPSARAGGPQAAADAPAARAVEATVRRAGLAALVMILVVIFVLDIRMPDVVLLPFLAAPVVAAATFLRPRATAFVGIVAVALGMLTGVVDGGLSSDDYWVRLAGLLVVCLVAVQLSRLATSRELALAAREKRYRLLADNATDAVFLMDLEWVITWASPTVTTQLGYAADEVLGRHRRDFTNAADRDTAVGHELRATQGLRSQYEERFVLAGGTSRWMSVALSPFADDAGIVIGFVAALRDIDDEVRFRKELDRSERTFRLAMAGAAEGMAVVGPDGRFVEVNGVLGELVGRDESWLIEHTEENLFPDDASESIRSVRDRLLSGVSARESHPRRLLEANGREIWINHAVGLIRDEHGDPLFYVCQYQDVTAAHVARLDLAGRVNRDPLTGVASRSHLLDVLTHTDWRDHRRGLGVGLLYCDIDHFKTINDTFGHAVGDDVLRIVADRIAVTVRDGDVVGRMGGDEFVVVLRGVHGVQDAQTVAEKIRTAVARPIAVAGRSLTCHLSVGISVLAHGDSLKDSLDHADSALYEAKRNGRDRASVYDRLVAHH